MGTVRDYLSLHEGLLIKRIPWWPELGPEPATPFWLADGKTADSVSMSGWVCAGKVELGRDIRLSRVVLWDGVSVPDGSLLQDTLVVE